jgi:hypothetical protein
MIMIFPGFLIFPRPKFITRHKVTPQKCMQYSIHISAHRHKVTSQFCAIFNAQDIYTQSYFAILCKIQDIGHTDTKLLRNSVQYSTQDAKLLRKFSAKFTTRHKVTPQFSAIFNTRRKVTSQIQCKIHYKTQSYCT